ncbi:MAG: outer membrane lipoprotein carrier protein LolA [Nitrospirae bacterium]|uniref:LolA family protein n=1 Tax=Candidatus Magnetobacterium casense TaxID=1455061 RepID=UPI00058EFBBC|nr:outer membrane lipoprotein carrier protein LolA [Candidatus Magnetobacterium casensis]MBF0337145.1 outer membrane lipoprotein carrier protein LolA [Nitrospirota bacterium]
MIKAAKWRMPVYLLLCVAILVSLMHTRTGAEDTRGKFLARVKEVYSTLKDVKGHFNQTSRLKDLGKEMNFRGEFFIKIPNRLFWYYDGDQVQEVYVNDNVLIVYQKKLSQAIRTRYDAQTMGQSPIALLSGLKDVEKHYDITDINGALRLVPKTEFNNMKHFDIYPSESGFPIKKIIVTDLKDNTIEITLKDVRLNTNIIDETFTFTPPKDTKIVDN